MKLNLDCIRSTLMEIEKQCSLEVQADNTVVFHSVWIGELYDALPEYSKEDIFYSIFTLHQCNMIDATILYADDCVVHCCVNLIKYSGHEFLENIRDSKRWTKAKKLLGEVKNYSLEIVNSACSGLSSGAVGAIIDRLANGQPIIGN